MNIFHMKIPQITVCHNSIFTWNKMLVIMLLYSGNVIALIVEMLFQNDDNNIASE